MSLLMHYQQENAVGVFRLEGIKSYSNGVDAWMRFMRTLNEKAVGAILVFDNSTTETTSTDVFNIAEILIKNHFPRDKKVAIVAPENGNYSLNSFGESVLNVRGWENIKAFADEIEAREWLKLPLVFEAGIKP